MARDLDAPMDFSWAKPTYRWGDLTAARLDRLIALEAMLVKHLVARGNLPAAMFAISKRTGLRIVRRIRFGAPS